MRTSRGEFTFRLGRGLLRTYSAKWLLGRASQKDKRREVRTTSYVYEISIMLLLILIMLFLSISSCNKTDEIVNEYAQVPFPTVSYEKGVDLGLPSGLIWASCNIGAILDSDYGEYYAWGETSPKSSYTEDNYIFFRNGEYEIPIAEIAGTQYDAARQKWGGKWRTPTRSDWDELISNCQFENREINGHNVVVVVGPNSKQILLPKAGCKWDLSYLDTMHSTWVGNGCSYQSSTYNDCGDGMFPYFSYYSYYSVYKWGYGGVLYIGRPIRPVYSK